MKHTPYRYLGILGALLIPAVAIAALQIPNTFHAGDPLSASALNANFAAVQTEANAIGADLTSVKDGISGFDFAGASTELTALRAEVDQLKADADARADIAGYVTMPDEIAPVPFYRKVLKGHKDSDLTTIPHGLDANAIKDGRVLFCKVQTLDYSTWANFQGTAAGGSSAVQWCYLHDDVVEISWVTTGAREFRVLLDYVKP
jgi:hypothetical protein